MKLLVLAEARLADIPLRAATVPMQITISDGGEDGRVEWSGGALSTNYFPSVFCLFQSKAQKVTEASIRNEVLKKNTSKGRKAKPTLSPAMREVLSRKGSYIVFSSKPFTAPKIKKLKDAIRKAVRDGVGNPSRLAAIEIYDANKIAEWVNTHPSVALWLTNHERRRSVAGFQTHEGWGKAREITSGPWIDGNAARFTGVNVPPDSESKEPESKLWTFEQASEEVAKRLASDHQSIRVAGPSGYGKSRFVYELFNRDATIGDAHDRASVIYADFAIVGDEVQRLALEIADSGAATILIVDECSDNTHLKLASTVQRRDSKLRIITMDVETSVVQANDTLTIRLEAAPKEMITAIAKGVAPKLSDSDSTFVQELSHGFPQMAVLAAQHKGSGQGVIRSIAQLFHRIVWGQRAPNPDAQRALEAISMFEWIGLTGRVSDQARLIAAELAGLNEDAFVEHVKSFKSRGVVVQRGEFAQVQPLPLAAKLASRRWDALAEGKMLAFFEKASGPLKESLLRRIRWLDTVPQARDFAVALLKPSVIGNFAALNTDFGAKCLDRLVHVDPDLVMATITRVFGHLSMEELKGVTDGRRHLVWALEKLAFLAGSFTAAATLLRRLGAAETEDGISNNASGQFKQLYQLHLSGTEAEPSVRLLVLDEGLASNDPNERAVSLAALDHMLDTGHFTRGGGAEEIGSRARLEDWCPKTYGEIRNFHRAAINRLVDIALNDQDPLAGQAKNSLGSHIRGLIRSVPFEDVKNMIERVTAKFGFWPEAIQELNGWLFFDRRGSPAGAAKAVRDLFDRLMPTDPVELVGLYTLGWQSDFHDPDADYDSQNRTDFEYAARKSVELADLISRDPALVERALDKFVSSEARTLFPFARRFAELAFGPIELFSDAIRKADAADGSPNLQFFGGMIAGIDGRDPKMARECIRIALRSQKLKTHAISMIGSGKLQPSDLELVASLLRSGDVEPWQCAPLSCGRGVDHLSPSEFMPLLDELSKHGSSGLWAALDIVSMYLHDGREPEPLLIRKIKNLLLSPQLLKAVNRRTMDGYTLEQMVAKLVKYKAINQAFARALTKQLVSICTGRDHNLFYELDDPVRKALRILINENPQAVWAEIAPVLLSRDWLVRDRAEHLVEFGHDNNLGAGLLIGMPADIYLQWARKDPKNRASIIMHWLPIANRSVDGTLAWHPDLETFVEEFGGEPKVLGELRTRLRPRSWWGSLMPHIEPLLPLLQQWSSHRNAAVREWAQKMQETVRVQITDEKRRNDEEAVLFG